MSVVALQTPSPLRPRDYDPAQLALIRRTVAADTTADEFNMFIEIAKRAGLDPFRRQLYCIVYSKDKPDKRKVTFITGIDGFRAVAARNKDYRPDDEEALIVYDDEAKNLETNPLGIVKATVKAHKMAPSGEWFPVSGTAYWSEFAPLKDEWAWNDEKGKRLPTGRITLDPSSNWYKMGRVMICKCAEAQALRKGWPEDLSGIYSPEEMDRPMLDITPTDAIEQHEQAQRMARVGGTNTIAMVWKVGEAIEAVPVGKMADRCAAHIRTLDSVTELEWWWATNEVSLRQLWAMHKSDGRAVQAEHEARKAALAG